MWMRRLDGCDRSSKCSSTRWFLHCIVKAIINFIVRSTCGKMARKKSKQKQHSSSSSKDISRIKLLSNILTIGSCGLCPPLVDIEDDTSVQDILLKPVINDGQVLRSKVSLAIDRYVKVLRQYLSQTQTQSRSQHINEEEDGNNHIRTIQQLEEEANSLREAFSCLNNLVDREREVLLELRHKFDYKEAAIDFMYSRFIIEQHFRQKQFEQKAYSHAIRVLMTQYDIGELDNNSIYQLQKYSDGVRRRLYINKLELEKIYDYIIYSWNNIDKNTHRGDVGPARDSGLCPNIPLSTDNNPHPDVNHDYANRRGILRILHSQGLDACIEHFLSKNTRQPGDVNILVSGDDGSGKTHLCETISRLAQKASITVIKPTIPIDFMASTIGRSVDLVFSLFYYASSVQGKCIVILDNIDNLITRQEKDNGSLFSVQEGGSKHDQSSKFYAAMRSAFMMSLRRTGQTNRANNIFLLCTIHEKIELELTDCFDFVEKIKVPNESKRKKLISDCLFLRLSEQRVCNLMDKLVNFTAGRSIAEIVGLCRQVVSHLSHNSNDEAYGDYDKLSLLHDFLRNSRSLSSNDGSFDGLIDIKVENAHDLMLTFPRLKDSIMFPLCGHLALNAWKKLESVIIPPLCRSEELQDILQGGMIDPSTKDGGKVVCTGALIIGAPGTGKSTLARYCAYVASTILPSIKLLEVPCTSLIHKEVGGSERALKKLFQVAKLSAPCILLLDGLENIAPVRGYDNTSEGTMDRLVSSLLIELDGIDGSGSIKSSRIAVIGITNNKNWVDLAVRRPGRLEACIELTNPDITTRKQIFHKQLSKVSLDFSDTSYFSPKDFDQLVEFLTIKTNDWSAAEIIALCQDAQVSRIREFAMTKQDFNHIDSFALTMKNFDEAIYLRNKGSLNIDSK